jgi:hypothetical protein
VTLASLVAGPKPPHDRRRVVCIADPKHPHNRSGHRRGSTGRDGLAGTGSAWQIVERGHPLEAEWEDGGVAERTDAAALKLGANDVSASDRTLAALTTAALSRWGQV